MFDAIAPRYDLINSFLSLGMHSWWRRRMVAALKLQPGAPRLDRADEASHSTLVRRASIARTSSTAWRACAGEDGLVPTKNSETVPQATPFWIWVRARPT